MTAASLGNARVLVTGATGGVGEALVRRLVNDGATVLVHGRETGKVVALAAELRHMGGGDVLPFVADLASLAEVIRLAREVLASGPLTVLVNNAGVGFGRDRTLRELSRDGFELRLAVNYLAPFLLTEQLTAAGLPKHAVVNVASAGQAPVDESDLMSERAYDGVLAYRRSKLALIADTLERARRDSRRSYLALHPGTFLATKMVLESGITPRGTPEQGANAVLAVIARALSGDTGKYYEQSKEAPADPSAYDPALQESLRHQALALTAAFRATDNATSPTTGSSSQSFSLPTKPTSP
jgi:NAD(P)-dependent dehydrogenase (short-subunit alcohol dehydrogenase family)